MDLDTTTLSPADAPNRRKSGRAVQKPQLYQEDPRVSLSVNGNAKRKRSERVGDDGEDATGESSSEEEDDGESEPDEEELKEQRRRARGKAGQKKPAAKKPKRNENEHVSLAMRPATNGVKKSSKARKQRTRVTGPEVEGTGLYAEVFLAENNTDDVANGWIDQYNNNNAEALCELINFVLKCAGCDLKLDVHDIEDPDNAQSRLADLQEEFQTQKITDYPLISRTKGISFSRQILSEFLMSFVQAAHARELFYNDDELYENLQVWLGPMSSSSSRPFRHTATVVALSLATALCAVLKEIISNTAAASRQKEAEERKKTINRGRVTALKNKVEEHEARHEATEKNLRDIYEVVFVNRYRDIDPNIRVDCAEAIGTWILACPDVFFDGATLRYLGWQLSDIQMKVRASIVKQLLKIYRVKENVGRLRAFTERFRPRMVEMATQDADSAIRSDMIKLLDYIRGMGLLEPDDIDTVGRMIFDTDSRVRRAIAGFFSENINDFLESAVDELGEETLNEALGEDPEDDYDSPRQGWLKLKCLAEVLDSYDADQKRDDSPELSGENMFDAGVETRYSVAASVVCAGVEEAKDWEVIAGYLLYDNSTTRNARHADDPIEIFKKRCQLNEKEETLLLEILHAAVKSRLDEAIEAEHDRHKKTKMRKDEGRQLRETTAVHLASIIPRLLRKFGARPATASPVLRLGLLLDLEIFNELRQDSSEFASLLDDINSQFLSHADHGVLKDARDALLYAREFEDLEEVTESKLQELWDGTAMNLRQLVKARTPQMANLANTTHRIANLASISDCVENFEKEPRNSSAGRSDAPTKVLDILLDLIRGYADVVDQDGDSLVNNAMTALQFYFMWVVRSVQGKVAGGEQLENIPSPEDYITAMTGVVEGRDKLDDVRLNALGHILDTCSLFATFRNVEVEDNLTARRCAGLAQEASSKVQQLALQSFATAEKVFAKKSNRSLESTEEDVDQEPESAPEDSSEEEEEGDDEEQARRARHRQQEQLLAEKRLCELTGKMVMAIIARVIDSSGSTKGRLRARMLRNKSKLGPNFKEVLAYLEEPKPKRSHKAKPQAVQPAPNAKSAEMVEDEDDEIEEVEDDVHKDVEDEGSRADESEAEQDDRDPVDEIEDDIMGD